MACAAEWDAMQLATSARIAAEILLELAQQNFYDTQAAEYSACIAWFDCDYNQSRSANPQQMSREEAIEGLASAKHLQVASQFRVAQLKAQYVRATGKTYDGGKS